MTKDNSCEVKTTLIERLFKISKYFRRRIADALLVSTFGIAISVILIIIFFIVVSAKGAKIIFNTKDGATIDTCSYIKYDK